MVEKENLPNQKYRKKHFKNNTLLYNRECVIYGALHIPMKTRRIKIGAAIYIETLDGFVFKTADLKEFEFVSSGRLLGLVGSYVICKGTDLCIYNNEKECTSVQFYMRNGQLCYCHSNESVRKGEQESILADENSLNSTNGSNRSEIRLTPEHIVVYKRFVVVANGRTLLFIPFDQCKDVYYSLPRKITGLKVRKVGRISLVVAYYGEGECLYYSNILLYSGTHRESKKLKVYSMHAFDELLLKVCQSNAMIADVLRGTIPAESIHKAQNTFLRLLHSHESIESLSKLLNDYASFQSTSPANLNEKSIQIYDLIVSFSHEIARLLSQDYFYEACDDLYNLYKNVQFDILGKQFLSREYSRVFSFDPTITSSKNLAYKVIYIEQKYLEKRTSAQQSQDSHNTEETLLITTKQSKQFLTAFRIIHKDRRAEEIVALMTENSIAIEADADDGDSIRQKFFLMRLLGNFGLMLMDLENNFQINGEMRFNGKALDELVTPEMIFILGINYGCLINDIDNMWDNSWNRSVFEMGCDFCHALKGTLKEEKYQSYVEKLQTTDIGPSTIDYIILVVAAYRRDIKSTEEAFTGFFDNASYHISNSEGRCSVVPGDRVPVPEIDTNLACSRLNAIFSSFLPYGQALVRYAMRASNIKNKSFAMVALGIHNINSNDRVVFNNLIAEANRFGTDEYLKGDGRFYNRSYRRLAAVSASLVYSSLSPLALDDSFSRLIIDGMSFMGKKIFKNALKRYDSCHLDEVFYSELFILVNDFGTTSQQILEYLNASKDGEIDEIDSRRAAAKLFYLSLLHFYNKNDGFSDKRRCAQIGDSRGYSKVLPDVVEPLFLLASHYEDSLPAKPNMQLMLDFALVSLSLLLNSTFDLRLLRILRRQILKTKEVGGWTNKMAFNDVTKDISYSYEPGLESITYYRLCLGLVCCGLGERRLSLKRNIDFKVIVVAFFYTNNKLLCFQPFDILRSLTFLATNKSNEFGKSVALATEKVKQKEQTRKVTKYLINKLERCCPADRKFVVDVLSDYYENYHDHRFGTVLDIKLLAKMLGISR